MLEKLITRVNDLINLGDPKYIFEFNIDMREDMLTCKFTHCTLPTREIKGRSLKWFCDEVNKYLDKLEEINYKPKFKVGDIARFGHKLHDKKILAIIDTEYVVEFIDGGDIRLIPMFDVDKYHTLF